MTQHPDFDLTLAHRHFAVECYNQAWDLINKADRTPEQARMRLRYQPQRPTWRPLYSWHSKPIKSWARFLGEAYWNVTLQDE